MFVVHSLFNREKYTRDIIRNLPVEVRKITSNEGVISILLDEKAEKSDIFRAIRISGGIVENSDSPSDSPIRFRIRNTHFEMIEK